MCDKNQTPVEWLVAELSKKGFFYVTDSSYQEFKTLIQKAQQLEIDRLKKVKTYEYIKFSFSLN
jgi:hypothetical protein